jgi:hypothetical protein
VDALYKSGFAFFRELAPGLVEFENKFTGLRIIYDVKSGTKTVREA